MSAYLYIIPSPLGEDFNPQSFPNEIKFTIEKLNHFIVENEKEARRFIKQIAPEKKQSDLVLYPLNKHTSEDAISTYLNPCSEGNNMGLISDAGCPGIADPGAIIVQNAYENNIKVKPLTGPSSILLAMMSSGLNGQNFAFNGYLPIDKGKRKKAIKALENRSQKFDQSQIFMETPYRNEKLFEELKLILDSKTKLSIAFELTQPEEFINTMSVAMWRKTKIRIHKKPAIFTLHKEFYR